MKICSMCLYVEGLKVEQPQMLRPTKGCGYCHDTSILSYNVEDIRNQIKELSELKDKK